MKLRVFIDTNVFIYAFEYDQSNSAKIIDLINNRKLRAIISTQVIKEIVRYFEKYHTNELASMFRKYLLQTCIVISKEKVIDKMEEYKGKIKDKDLEQLAVVKKLMLKFLISYDRDFKPFKEYITPKQFIKLLGLKESKTEF